MGSTATAYLTGFGRYLPGDPVDNDGIAARLGGDDPVTERIRRRVLDANGIRQRHYALDEHGEFLVELGRLGGGPMQLLSASGVCASSLAALDAAASKIRLGDHAAR